MKPKKYIIDLTFIILNAIMLVSLIQFDLMEKYIGFGLIPILIAYYFGQYVGKKEAEKE